MRKTIRIIIAMTMLLVMMTISPMTDLSQSLGGMNDTTKAKAATIAKAAETDDANTTAQLYISEIKIGNAYVDGEANPDKGMKDEATVAAELESEGYTVLRDGNAYANLNDGAGSKSGLKKGANHKIILFGYKTTANPKEAITDLAVMNMNGGYSIEDYEQLIKTQMDSQIKPFVDRFISTINEYRENLKKPKDSSNYRRADFVRKALNKLTDDDTGGQPMGDLLINKTKYEMGDDKYNALSDGQKKEHADILTILLQGNAKAILLMENLLSKAADTSDDNWIDRMKDISIDTLVEEVKDENPRLSTKKEIYDKLDKQYYDIAKQLFDKWDAFQEALTDNKETEEQFEESLDENKVEEAFDRVEEIGKDGDPEERADAVGDAIAASFETEIDSIKMQNVAAHDYLSDMEYQGDSMLDFFEMDSTELSDTNKIRKLYPIAASLSDGQIAGLEFMSMGDLVAAAMFDEAEYNDENLRDLPQASIYEDVDRGIYQKGGVALTNEAMRAKASAVEPGEYKYTPSTLTYIFLGVTAVVTVTTLSLVAVRSVILPKLMKKSLSTVKELSRKMSNLQGEAYDATKEVFDKQYDKLMELKGARDAISTKLMVGLTVAMALLMIATTVITVLDISSQYDTKFIPIPGYMVDETDITAYNEKGEKIVVKNQTAYYKAAICNRVEGDSAIEKENKETLLDRADLNGDIGRQWLALYYVKNENGYPILADSFLYRKGGGSVPSGYSTGIHEFGSTTAANLNKKSYLYVDEPPSIHVFFKNAAISVSGLLSGEKESAEETDGGKETSESGEETGSETLSGTAGSIFGESGSGITAAGLALGGGIGIVLGALLMALIMYLSRRKKIAVVGTDEREE